MEGNYDIFMGGQAVGIARVSREGLYYRFFCSCQLTGEIVYRITVTIGKQEENLGIPVPKEGIFYLNSRVPAKRFEKGNPIFRILPKHEPVSGRFVPIFPDEPFAYLSRLKDAYLEVKNNQIGVVLDH